MHKKAPWVSREIRGAFVLGETAACNGTGALGGSTFSCIHPDVRWRYDKRDWIAEARSSLPSIVGQVVAGQEIELTPRIDVAVVVSPGSTRAVRGNVQPFPDHHRFGITNRRVSSPTPRKARAALETYLHNVVLASSRCLHMTNPRRIGTDASVRGRTNFVYQPSTWTVRLPRSLR